ncbi:phosphatidate cytidylyltransferase [uncultured Polaribacter sp.]|uniref:phosphatidate cytidylyltransferase n=1 Tax=uncultured Polaribacter sp. TaxID=174711 RepID=UPI00262F4F2C|nr:phosphatidate cytidylyltransferase [uncultured Polaribacter sp.]
MRNLLRRSFSGIIYVLIFISSILFSKESYLFLIAIFGFLSIWEFSKIIKFKGYISYLLFALILFLCYQRQDSFAVVGILIITIISSLFLIKSLITKKEISFSDDRNKLGLMLRYLIFSMTFLALLPFYKGSYNPELIIGVLILIWVNDSFALLVGKNFGKRKLFVSVSPRKTQEGFIGGLVFSLLAAYFISKYYTILSTGNWMIVSVIVSVIGTLGDLVESKYKRFANVKDSGSLMPGHGGILDRLDSLLFASPFVYLFINYII